MSKFTKLVTNPELFMKDFVKNKINSYSGSNLEKKLPSFIRKEISSIQSKMLINPKNEKKLNNKNSPKKIEATLIMQSLSYHCSQEFTLIHCGESLTIGYEHCREWIGLTEKIKNNIAILVRNFDLYKKLYDEFPGRNILYAKTPIDIEELLSTILVNKICFVSNTANNIHLLRFNDYYHIFIGHFDYTRQPDTHKFFRVYDELWFSSEFKCEKFLEELDSRHLTIKNVLNPYNEFIFSENKFFKNLLFIPNFNLDIQYSFIMIFFNFVHERKCLDFIYNFHFEKKEDEIYKDALNKISNLINFVDASSSRNEILSHTDVVICDYTNEVLVKKYLALNIPVLIYVPEYLNECVDLNISSLSNDIFSNCSTFSHLDDLLRILNDLKNGNDQKAEKREAYLLYYYGLSKNSHTIFEKNIEFLVN